MWSTPPRSTREMKQLRGASLTRWARAKFSTAIMMILQRAWKGKGNQTKALTKGGLWNKRRSINSHPLAKKRLREIALKSLAWTPKRMLLSSIRSQGFLSLVMWLCRRRSDSPEQTKIKRRLLWSLTKKTTSKIKWTGRRSNLQTEGNKMRKDAKITWGIMKMHQRVK